MKLYNKPELNVEKFDVEDIITVSSGDKVNSEVDNSDVGFQSAGMEFDITAAGNEF
ncbi:MAG: hypothetical protein IKK49_05215 [Clostridia bacterium]|nr:hypothetical protein [Clostridia bacterium]